MAEVYDRLGHEQDDEYATRSPGPWRVHHSGDVLDRTGRLIAAMLPGCRLGDEQLVAAAPDLLNALAQMVVNCPVCARDVSFLEGVRFDGARCPHCYPARRVLDKATGEFVR